ncbi:MAG TPA: complex I NDUFA9 subunit family protein [Ottowia sp.]|uniref:complex I NDUFA9 subunit family protein n=1 Tax=Ottowia sp. TaxID=1898956 RepID=UPI002C392810|nr:complex I NDUFA9 subunit family protein [Ottowia sp.]HMN20899.1 complex I NDUFA9 subunit family protein [Ottowia sp.]
MALKVLILGGSGFVGRHLIEHLQRAGAEVTAPTRRLASAREIWPLPCVTVLEADVTQPETLARLLPGHDAVVNLVATLHGSAARFEHLHVELPRRLAQACAATGVRRLVHVSALGAAADGPSRYQRSKAAGEAVLQEAAVAGRIDLTVLRPSVIFGADDHFMTLFARLQRWFPLIPLAGADARFQPVWVRDVADALVRCLQRATTIGQTYEACGPEVYTLRELVRLAGQWAGVREGRGRPILGLPGPLAWLQALAMECLPGQPLLSRDNLDSMKVDNVASGQSPGLDALGITPASLLAVGPWMLGTAGNAARLEVLRSYAGR